MIPKLLLKTVGIVDKIVGLSNEHRGLLAYMDRRAEVEGWSDKPDLRAVD